MPKKFLLADDDQDDTDLFCEAANDADPSIVCYLATDGREVLEKLNDKTFEVPDVIFLDLNMPEMNGWECLKTLRSEPAYEHIPIIMYSTSSAGRDIERAYELGATYFFTKPDNFKELKRFLRLVSDNLRSDLPKALNRNNNR